MILTVKVEVKERRNSTRPEESYNTIIKFNDYISDGEQEVVLKSIGNILKKVWLEEPKN